MTDNLDQNAGNTPVVDQTVPQTARIWNYWLGGKDNYEVDRKVGDDILQIIPDMAVMARATRQFLIRAVRYLSGEAGVRQFLDIGTGLPTVDNTHEVAQAVAPEARIVYVDNDPLVLAHARALLTSSPEGATTYIDADLHDPGRILDEARKTLDFDRPIALMLMGILGHITDFAQAQSIVRQLLDALPSGSYLALYDATNVIRSPETNEAIRIWNESAKPPYVLRSPDDLARFFDGLDLVEPGIVSCPRWRPAPGLPGEPDEMDEFCGVGRKP
ncbi:S-adenosyl methyltransferase [Thermomonospora echinospora]|uniref:S-adenosyl methyltransferase n=1 Tax=Thermomonospora echinospora TaxID=1992 RepID=A0A1H6B291_9ACTN|nr:SAM-dependent methyltransferase [Thermomonospora echinospora]SEG54993.1 S-adenosyl methyltransferase [Thermomonospora echinospora]